MASLTKRQKLTLVKHKKHHSKKHMNFMKDKMQQGNSFTQAHNLAIKKVGK